MQDDPLLAGYELVWRPSSEQQWTHQYFVGKVNQVKVNLSKDNVIFGLRAVGTNGKKSPAGSLSFFTISVNMIKHVSQKLIWHLVFPMPLPSQYGAY